MNSFKALSLLIVMVFIICVSTGCNNSSDSGGTGLNGQGNDYTGATTTFPTAFPVATAAKNSYSETEWAADSSVRLNPGTIAADYLEPFDRTSTTNRPDSGGSDYDVIPLVMPTGTTYTCSLDPSDTTTTIKSAVLLDSLGNTIFTLDKTTMSATKYCAAGKYDLHIYSGYSVSEANEDHRIVFLSPGTGKDATGKYIQSHVDMLLKTNSCPGGDLSVAHLNNANLNGAILTGANLQSTQLQSAHLTGADLTGAWMLDVYLSSAHLEGAILIGANLNESHLSGAHLNGANLTGATLRSAGFQDAKMDGAILTRAKLVAASMNSASLVNASLYDADLTDAMLSDANLTKAGLTGATLTNAWLHNTTMPDGTVNNSGTNHPASWPF